MAIKTTIRITKGKLLEYCAELEDFILAFDQATLVDPFLEGINPAVWEEFRKGRDAKVRQLRTLAARIIIRRELLAETIEDETEPETPQGENE